MNELPVKIDVQYATYKNKERVKVLIAKVMGYLLDKEKTKRFTQRKCRYCFYFNNSRIGGAAFTNQPCGICKKDQTFGSTATDDVCEKCSLEWEICIQCHADIHLRTRRNKSVPNIEVEEEAE